MLDGVTAHPAAGKVEDHEVADLGSLRQCIEPERDWEMLAMVKGPTAHQEAKKHRQQWEELDNDVRPQVAGQSPEGNGCGAAITSGVSTRSNESRRFSAATATSKAMKLTAIGRRSQARLASFGFQW